MNHFQLVSFPMLQGSAPRVKDFFFFKETEMVYREKAWYGGKKIGFEVT